MAFTDKSEAVVPGDTMWRRSIPVDWTTFSASDGSAKIGSRMFSSAKRGAHAPTPTTFTWFVVNWQVILRISQ
jgi:hypothetical protein